MPHINALIRATCAPDLFFSARRQVHWILSVGCIRWKTKATEREYVFSSVSLPAAPTLEDHLHAVVIGGRPRMQYLLNCRLPVLCSQEIACTVGSRSSMYVRLQTSSRGQHGDDATPSYSHCQSTSTA
ncbi:hypothetical protein BDZ89DRAFT_1071668 [Hymenopellis radicata]|nr:hypothetical protein BDZ89DRAFT_1071668 [Hymenopellis radicata]